ncbi:hypothetical protein ACJMK2_021847 [Sinanodonta woodiana]|uniref:Uncharacterized protein n=1 Tax=Sinanodonta woodiana TaxID=1069815 RepID=A0ABD3THB0_SINWO
MRGKEGNNIQKRKYIDLSLLDVLDIEQPSVKRPALDDTGTVSPSVTSQFTEDTSAMRGEEGNNVQKRKYIDLSFLDVLDIEQPSVKRPALDDTGTVSPSVTSQFTEDTSAMRGEEGNNVQKRKYIDLSFSDDLDIEEILKNLPPLDDTGTVSPSVTSQFTEDTSAMRGEEGNNVQKRKYIDWSFSDDLDIEEILKNLPPLDDTETVTPKVQIISKKSRKVQPSLLVQLLKGLTSRKAYEYRMNICNEYLNNGRGLCCNNNCCMGWKYVDIKTILYRWI